MKDLNIKWIEGGVCAPKDFLATGGYVGLRKDPQKKDFAIIYSKTPCAAAAVYTLNRVKAAPLHVTMEHLKDGKAQAIVANSVNANACVPDGMAHANRMAAAAAKALGVDEKDCIVASTGVIGVPLNVQAIEQGLPPVAATLSSQGSDAAAEAIMTTDTYQKQAAITVEIQGTPVTIGAISKGAGMIHPNMGTTLTFLTTDAGIQGTALQEALSYCTKKTFNRISVDGDTSTNDMACIMANGAAKNPLIEAGSQEYEVFLGALMEICTHQARRIAADGEGATRLISCIVTGGETEEQAETLARSVIASSLVKAAMFGRDANWGRVLCAMGYSGAAFDVNKVDIFFRSSEGCVQVCRDGGGLAFDEEAAKKIISASEVEIVADLKSGCQEVTAWGCDLTYEYVKINGDYRS